MHDKILDQIDFDLFWETEGRKWRATQDALSDKEWFAQIPDLKPILKEKEAEWLILERKLTFELKEKILYLKRIDCDIRRTFCRELLKHSLVKELLTVKGHLKRISNQPYQLKPHKKSKNHISGDEITSAKEYPLINLVEEHVSLRRSGSNFYGLCPFHEEKHPSFYIFTKSNTFKCFGCQKGGDSIEFLRNINNLSFIEAVKELNRK